MYSNFTIYAHEYIFHSGYILTESIHQKRAHLHRQRQKNASEQQNSLARRHGRNSWRKIEKLCKVGHVLTLDSEICVLVMLRFL